MTTSARRLWVVWLWSWQVRERVGGVMSELCRNGFGVMCDEYGDGGSWFDGDFE